MWAATRRYQPHLKLVEPSLFTQSFLEIASQPWPESCLLVDCRTNQVNNLTAPCDSTYFSSVWKIDSHIDFEQYVWCVSEWNGTRDVSHWSSLGSCLSQGFYSCTNIMTKNQVGEERVYLAYTSILLSITKEVSRSGSRSRCRGHGGMFLTGLLHLACSACSLIKPRLPAQRSSHPQGAFPPWSLIEKMPYSWTS
jgi:hypothetical protein